MFTYTKEIIINSMYADQDAYGSGQQLPKIQSVITPAPNTAPAGVLRILRAGEYKQENIQGARIFKTPGVVGQTATMLVPNAAGLMATAGIYRVSIYIGMAHKYLGDFAHANWYPFGKALVADFSVADGMSAAEKMQQMTNAINLTIPRNNIFARTVLNGVDLSVYLTDPYAFIARATLEWYDPNECNLCSGFYTEIPEFENLVEITRNVEPFATAAWLVENLRFPSYPNVRYAALYADEYPIAGQLYTMYSFAYDVERTGYFGLNGVNEKMGAVTRHVYYVLNSEVAAFEAQVTAAFPNVAIVENNTVMITTAPTVANDGVAIQLVATTWPMDSSATITWASADLPADVTLTSTGILTADPAAVVGATFTVTATSSNPDYKEASILMTVIAG